MRDSWFQRLIGLFARRSFVRDFLAGDGLSHPGMVRPYAQSVWVQRAIKKVTQPISSVPVRFYVDNDEVTDDALTRWMEAPARGLSRPEFMEAAASWLKLSGEFFLLMGDDMLQPFAMPGYSQVILARPDRIRHIVDRGSLIGWSYRDGAGMEHSLLPDQVIHRRLWNPYDDFRGLGEYEAASIAAKSDYLAGTFAKNLMANNGDQGVYVVARGGMPSDEQREQIVNSLRAKRAAQQRGEFRPVFLTGDITVEDPKIASVDANFSANRLQNRHEIFIAFGVPPSMADKMESYSVGSASDWFILLTETCIPTSRIVCSAIDGVLDRFGLPDVTAECDFDEHPVMQAVRRERIDTGLKLWSTGVPMSQINDYLQLGMEPFAGWDIGYLPFSVAPAGAALPDVAPEFGEEPIEPEPDAVEAMARALAQTAADDEPAPNYCGCDPQHLRASDRDPRELNQWREMMVKRRAVINDYIAKFNLQLMVARSEVLRNIESKKMLSALNRAAAADFIFSLDKFAARLKTALRNSATNALQVAGKQLLEEIGKKDDPWRMPPEAAQRFLATRDNRIGDAAQNVFDQVMGTLREGLDAGDTTAELANRVRAEFNDISQKRARTIAMTETAAAYGVARQESMESAGIKYKRWLTSGNANVRSAHAMVNGATVPVTENFTVIDPRTGQTDHVAHPGDPTGAPWNVINCHCVAISVTEP